MSDLDQSELDLLGPLGRVDPPEEETMRRVATRFAAEARSVSTVRHTRSRLLPRRPALRRLVIGGGALAATAAVIAAVTVVTGGIAGNLPHTTDNAAAPTGRATGPTTLRGQILAAFDTNANSIMFAHQVTTMPGSPSFTEDSWFSTLQPKPGEQVVQRGRSTQGSTIEQDASMVYLQPADNAPPPPNCPNNGRVPSAPNMQLALVDGESIVVEYDTRTWSDVTNTCLKLEVDNPDSPSTIRAEIARNYWRQVPGQQTVDGQPAIELTHTDDIGYGVPPLTDSLWVGAQSYLPIEDVTHLSVGRPKEYTPQTLTTTFSFLPDTPANRAQLKPAIPPGFTHTAKPPVQHS
ncbi:MAG TPA: hypothetical protein VHX38_38555 [Pseudonocardiaceae bacterium]|jgi:hypothetical protein|nr:hypothetical protein [Pseudonocardiaceae bacterium]